MKIRQAKKIVRNLIRYPHHIEPSAVFDARCNIMLINIKNNGCKMYYTSRQISKALRKYRPSVRTRIAECQAEWYDGYIKTRIKPDLKEALIWIKYAAK